MRTLEYMIKNFYCVLEKTNAPLIDGMTEGRGGDAMLYSVSLTCVCVCVCVCGVCV